MHITFIRHLKVAFTWKLFYNSRSFDLACQEYDRAPVLMELREDNTDKAFYISTLNRTQETLKAFTNTKDIIQTDLLNEIPLVSFTNTFIKLPTIVWMIFGRIQWYFNSKRQPETRRESKLRVCKFLDELEKSGQDCLIVGHGFYFTQLLEELQKRGVVGNMNKRIKNGELEGIQYIEKSQPLTRLGFF